MHFANGHFDPAFVGKSKRPSRWNGVPTTDVKDLVLPLGEWRSGFANELTRLSIVCWGKSFQGWQARQGGLGPLSNQQAQRSRGSLVSVTSPAVLARSTASEPKIPASVEAVLQSQLPWIRRRLRVLFPPHLDLDELEQQVLLNVMRSLPSYRGDGSLRAWVDSITLRVGMKHARRVRARERCEQALTEGLCEAHQRLPSEAYFQRRQLQGLLAALPPDQERAVVLRHVVGLEVSEVAEHQGIPTETARSRLRVGMQKLRHRARIRETALR